MSVGLSESQMKEVAQMPNFSIFRSPYTCSILMSLRMRFNTSLDPDSTPTRSRRRPDACSVSTSSAAESLVGAHGRRDLMPELTI